MKRAAQNYNFQCTHTHKKQIQIILVKQKIHKCVICLPIYIYNDIQNKNITSLTHKKSRTYTHTHTHVFTSDTIGKKGFDTTIVIYQNYPPHSQVQLCFFFNFILKNNGARFFCSHSNKRQKQIKDCAKPYHSHINKKKR